MSYSSGLLMRSVGLRPRVIQRYQDTDTGRPQYPRVAFSKASKLGQRQLFHAKLRAAKGQQPVTGPLQVVPEPYEAELESTITPWWSSFCGAVAGRWQGEYAAFSPITGEAEPLTKNKDGEMVYDLRTQTVDIRVMDEEAGVDKLVRKTLKAPSIKELKEAVAEPDNPGWVEEEILNDENIMFFYGGSYFRGPLYLLPQVEFPPDTTPVDDASRSDWDRLQDLVQVDFEEAAPTTNEAARVSPSSNGVALLEGAQDNFVIVPMAEEAEEEEDAIPAFADIGRSDDRHVSTLEACIFKGGEDRVRVQLTLDVGQGEDGELDVVPIRVAMLMERWECTSEKPPEACILDRGSDPPLSSEARLSPASVSGRWATFDLMGVPAKKRDPKTGTENPIATYYGQEGQQRWALAQGKSAKGGRALWLPGGVMVELCTVPRVSRGAIADAQEGMQSGGPSQGLLVSVLWQTSNDIVTGITREYGSLGELLEVRTTSAMRGERKGR